MEIRHADLLIRSFEAFPNFVIIGSDERIVFINQSYCRLLGTTMEEAINRPVTEVIPHTLLPEILATGRTDESSMMTLFNHETGKDVSVICSRIPLKKNGKIIGAVAVTTFSDVRKLDELNQEIQSLRQENNSYRQKIARLTKNNAPLDQIIGNSPGILAAKKTIQDFAGSDLPVLITGETGVGKEVFATALQEMSRRQDQPFVKINCAAIPSELLESELFGYEAGAFTGARSKGKKGLFEAADHGTILLDEIGEMPLPLQAKLLRVLQEGEIQRIGSTETIPIDVRLICSTNRNISEMIHDRKFREDLYYRINTVEIEIPPLRERTEDLKTLCDYFIRKINHDSGTHTLGIEPDVIRLFQQYSWPGNIRELKHVMDRLSYLNQNGWIQVSDCDFFLRRSSSGTSVPVPENPASSNTRTAASSDRGKDFLSDHSHVTADIRKAKADAEIRSILSALHQSGGNKAKAARILGIDRSVLYYKLRKYQIG